MHFISISDLTPPDWRFLEPYSHDPALSWSTHHGRPRNALERLVTRPALGRYRAVLSAVREARAHPRATLVSHLPRVAAATNAARAKLCPDAPHIAFAFNFTDLPEGKDRTRLTRWLAGIDSYVVFSRYEQALYNDHLALPEDRITFLPWTMDPPQVSAEPEPGSDRPYFASIGGEGRDYALLADAMRALPHMRMVIVARPYSVTGIDFPENVTVHTNLPGPRTWRIAADSLGLVVPLKSDRTACGHITIVGSQHLGLPLLVTRSLGIEDYVTDGQTGLLTEAGDKDSLISKLRLLADDRAAAQHMGSAAQAKARQENTPQVWLNYFERFAAQH